MTSLTLIRAGSGTTVQDMGRPGHIATGLSRGGAADRLALMEAWALLGATVPLAALELSGTGAEIEADAPMRLALTGAPMRASLDGQPVHWNRTLRIAPGQRLTLGPADDGLWSYLTPGGGIDTPVILGSRSTHRQAGLGTLPEVGAILPCGADLRTEAPDMTLSVEDRLHGGPVRMMDGPQTALFSPEMRERFLSTRFARAPQGNRQGVRLSHDGAPFTLPTGRDILSDMIVPGDIQMTGEGAPFVLLAECQTIGGYPRIGTVLPQDLPRVAQAQPGTALTFTRLGLDAVDALPSEAQRLAALRLAVRARLRDPRDIADLLAYQLISGVTAGDET